MLKIFYLLIPFSYITLLGFIALLTSQKIFKKHKKVKQIARYSFLAVVFIMFVYLREIFIVGLGYGSAAGVDLSATQISYYHCPEGTKISINYFTGLSKTEPVMLPVPGMILPTPCSWY